MVGVGVGGGDADEVIHRVVAPDLVEMEQVTPTMCIFYVDSDCSH